VLEVTVVVVDEVPNCLGYVTISPFQPIFYGWLNVKDSVTVEFSRIHLTDLILVTVVATTVDTSKDNCVFVEFVAGDFATVAQFEDALTHFHCCTVDFVKKQDYCVVTGIVQPFGSKPLSDVVLDLWETKQVTLSHLRCTTLDNRQATFFGNLVDDSGLTNTMPTTNEDRKLCIND
jgi:hypothetical protein